MLKSLLLIYILLPLSLAFAQLETRIGDNHALVIIDMQPYFVNRNGTSEDPDNKLKIKQILKQQKELIKMAKKKNMPIVVVEYDLASLGLTKGIETTAELTDEIGTYKNVKKFLKDKDGMFDSSNYQELVTYLNTHQIGNLIITGANAKACVQDSISGAIRNNFNVIAYSQGIADFNFKSFLYPFRYTDEFKFTACSSCRFANARNLLELGTKISRSLTGEKENISESSIEDSDRSMVDKPTQPTRIQRKENSATRQ